MSLHRMLVFALLISVAGCKSRTDESELQSAKEKPLPEASPVVEPGEEGFNYSLDNEALWSSPASHFNDGCGQEAGVWNKIVASEYPKKNDYYVAKTLPPPQSRWDTVLGILKKLDTSMPTFIVPHRDGNKKYTAEEVPDKATFAKAIAFMKKVGSLGVLGGTKSGRTRDKVIHSSGSVAKIAFIPDQKSVNEATFPYTGMLKYGAPCGFIRAGLAVSNAKHPFTPGIALKFYVNSYPDGNPAKAYPVKDENPQSTNVLAMYSLDGQAGTNFFENSVSNIIPYPNRPEIKIGAQYFAASLIAMGARPGTDESDPTILSVGEMGQFMANGKRADQARAPFRLTFRPTEAAKKLYASGGAAADVRQILLRFSSGMTLYEVFATDDRKPQGAAGSRIGWIVLRTGFKASQYGDEMLHFRHVKPMQNSRFN